MKALDGCQQPSDAQETGHGLNRLMPAAISRITLTQIKGLVLFLFQQNSCQTWGDSNRKAAPLYSSFRSCAKPPTLW